MNRRFRLFLQALLGCVALVAVPRTGAQPYGLETRPTMGAFLNGALPEFIPPPAGDWETVPVFTNLFFSNAVGLIPVPGTNLLCVWEREGRVFTFTNTPDVPAKKLVLDLNQQCQGWGDCGLLGVAFHPGFVTNRQMFVWYTWVTPGTVQGSPVEIPPTFLPTRDRLARYTIGTNGVIVPGSELILIDQNAICAWHNGGGMFFHPTNGFLYLTVGDDNSAVTNCQRIDRSLFSGVLRLDVDRRGGGISHPRPRQPLGGVTSNYFIPNDNPFVGVSNALEEFFALGLRSPHRMTHDEPSGRIFIGDVGHLLREEINVIEPNDPPGLNFQWDTIEGAQGDLTPPFVGVNRRPLLDYDRSDGDAIIGGLVYRGSRFAAQLGGKYIFGDNVRRKVWALNETNGAPTKTLLCVMPQGIGPTESEPYQGLSSFGRDHAGEIYLCQMGYEPANIYTLQLVGPPPTNAPAPPATLSGTGAFTLLSALVPHPGLIPYDVGSALWSDGAAKRRWMAIPSATNIGFSVTGEWSFPRGSVFVKHFDLPLNDNLPAQRHRLETRLLALDSNGTTYGYSYKWRADHSDADVLTNGVTEALVITNLGGGTRTQQWFYPGPADCLRCHTAAAGYVLGPKTRQLNCEFAYPPANITDNQLRTLNHIGLFGEPLAESAFSNYARLVPVTNAGASLELRARSYLDANCAHCHRPGGVHAQWDGRYDTLLAEAGIVHAPAQDSLGVIGARIVLARDVGKSILHLRAASSVAGIQMPPLARNVADTNALAALAAWINSLPLPATEPVLAIAMTNGLPRLELNDVPGSVAVLESSVNFSNWLPRLTNTATGLPWQFLDLDATNLPRNFYRLRQTN